MFSIYHVGRKEDALANFEWLDSVRRFGVPSYCVSLLQTSFTQTLIVRGDKPSISPGLDPTL